MPRAWTRRCVTQQGPQFARTEGLFLFARGDACDDRTLRAVKCEGIPSGELLFSRNGDGCSLSFFKEDTMSAASQLNAYRPLGVLLGGSFAPQRSIDPKPVVCALLRSRPRLVDAVGHVRSTGSASVAKHEAVRHHD